VDNEWYIKRYPDVADAIRDGTCSGAEDHYFHYGFYENRLPHPVSVDEEWYSAHYDDVRKAIEMGLIASGNEHFDHVGFAEGRIPYPGFSLYTPGAT
jgi:hypothetical protein